MAAARVEAARVEQQQGLTLHPCVLPRPPAGVLCIQLAQRWLLPAAPPAGRPACTSASPILHPSHLAPLPPLQPHLANQGRIAGEDAGHQGTAHGAVVDDLCSIGVRWQQRFGDDAGSSCW